MRASAGYRHQVVRDIIAAAVAVVFCVVVLMGMLIVWPRSVGAQGPTPSNKFANVVPPSTTVPPGASGIVVEGLLYGCAGLPTLQEVQESTVYWLNQGYEVWTELTINSVECSKTISQYGSDIVSIMSYVLSHAPTRLDQWLGFMLDEESMYGFSIDDLVSFNGNVAAVLSAFTELPTWFSTEVATGTTNPNYCGATSVVRDWCQNDFNAIVYASYPAPQIATDYMVELTNSFHQSFGTPNLVTWSTIYPAPYNNEATPVTAVNGVPYSITIGNITYYYDNQFCRGSCQPSPGDTDGDRCPDANEQQTAPGSELTGGRRDYLNPWDYFNPTHDGLNRIDDILKVVGQYFHDDTDLTPGLPPYSPGYNPDTDRTPLGPNVWNLGPPNGTQGVPDILAVLKQYFHDCS